MKPSNDATVLVPLTLTELEEVAGGEVESIMPYVFGKMSDDGEWGQPGYGDQGQFF